ncbi:Uncharacterised protein [Pseudomonas putida]|nr:Uncharacterised protein [Pseudomonas putida]
MLRAGGQVTEQAKAGVRIAALGAGFGMGLPVAEEIDDLLRCLHRIGELQGQAVGTVGAQFQHRRITDGRPRQCRMVALGRGVKVQLALGAGQRGQGGGVGLAQRPDLEQRVSADGHIVGLAGHAIAEIVRMVAGVDRHGHPADTLLLHQRADDLVDLGLQLVVGLGAGVAQNQCDDSR